MISHISGYPEVVIKYQKLFHRMMQEMQKALHSYGFENLDTSPVEKLETLLSKSGDNEIYGIQRANDRGNNFSPELGLRFDLTFSFARYIAQYSHDIAFPYKRYQTGYVWRGDRPQNGRYRQFYQFDIDIINKGDELFWSEIEVICLISKCLHILGLEKFTILVNHKDILSGIFESIGISQEKFTDIARLLDKSDKIKIETLALLLEENGCNRTQIDKICELVTIDFCKESMEVQTKILEQFTSSERFYESLEYMRKLITTVKNLNESQDNIVLVPRLARGLSYYTGFVCEVITDDDPKLGSICGGGTYSNLISNLGAKQQYAGVGVSIGLYRLFKLITDAYTEKYENTIMIATQDHSMMIVYMKFANQLRASSLDVFVYTELQNLSNQLKYASKRKFKFVVIFDKKEYQDGIAILRNMEEGTQLTVKLNELHQLILRMIKNV
ncbi:Histidine--tRNA ligase [Candidatus Fokinia solitaria]|uniref:Histidine--tRNA ligase n=1 Tax=Candidatus Fokinia solitaria TaxID=1802984 RepID=A0A2U8BRX4_9RICK|nr:histidine--tRNA ligase [Candidatus Fokinia solitaria]AWD33053.1 Histidine--tRNA ligase [Candidatus Fokinia solitaria]